MAHEFAASPSSTFIGDSIEFPAAHPDGFEYDDDEPAFDASIHLDIRAPPTVTLMDASVVAECPPPDALGSRLAFTAPMQLLSAEGLRVLRHIIEREKAHALSSARLAKYQRFLAYRSRWICDFNRCPQLTELFSRLAGQPLMPHSMPSNYAHTNIGEIGDQRNVDQWHADSVPFVVVILISDMTGASGGSLELIPHLEPPAAFELLRETDNQPPPERLLRASYPEAGSAIFMQGSRIIHHVTPVRNAREPRITVVNSYMPRDPCARECTKYATFKLEPTAAFEFARHKAWRAREQLHGFSQQAAWPDKTACVAALRTAAAELLEAAALLGGDTKDDLPYFDECLGRLSTQGYEVQHTKAQ